LSGFDKFKFGVKATKYPDLKKSEHQIAPRHIMYEDTRNKNYKIEGINFRLGQIFSSLNTKLIRFVLWSNYDSFVSMDNDFQKVQHHFEKLYGKEFKTEKYFNNIAGDSLYSYTSTWEWKTKEVEITEIYNISLGGKVTRNGDLFVGFYDNKFDKKRRKKITEREEY
jgi:hypothetical protein